MKNYYWVSIVSFLTVTQSSGCAEPSQDRFSIGERYQLVYEGGIRFQKGTFGSSRAGFAPGPIAVSEETSTVWIAGHAQHFSVGAYELPTPGLSHDIGDFPIAKNTQAFVSLALGEMPGGKPNRVTGMALIDGQLYVNATEYYDANADHLNTTVVFDAPHSLATSNEYGYFQMEGSAHAAGWMSPVPASLQPALGGTYLSGFANNLPIDSRHSIGPSLFIWEPLSPNRLVEADKTIHTTPLIDFSLQNRLHQDSYNKKGENDLWTEVSHALLGFVPLGTSDYLIVGRSGGHKSGIGYKITQDNGKVCAGPCAYRHDDYYNYFWRYDLKDVGAVREGSAAPHSVRPVEWGELPIFAGELGRPPRIFGGAFVPESSRLYLLIGQLDGTQSRYERSPVLLVYSLLDRGELSVSRSNR